MLLISMWYSEMAINVNIFNMCWSGSRLLVHYFCTHLIHQNQSETGSGESVLLSCCANLLHAVIVDWP